MPDLTPRQRQVLCLVTLTNREIGMRLGISRQTVRNHFTNIRMSLGLVAINHSPARLRILMRALQTNVVTLDEIELPPPLGWCWERVGQARVARWRE